MAWWSDGLMKAPANIHFARKFPEKAQPSEGFCRAPADGRQVQPTAAAGHPQKVGRLCQAAVCRTQAGAGLPLAHTNRVAISPRRLLRLDVSNRTVTFAWKDYANGAKAKVVTLELREFVRRFCLHLLPEHFVKIRHYGFLTNRYRQAKVAQARKLLAQQTLTQAVPPPAPVTDSALPARVCPFCGK